MQGAKLIHKDSVQSNTYRSVVAFTCITLIFIVTKALTFKGFNGTDDLHYAMLSAKLIKGEFSPFTKTDIFSGRMLLIFVQAIIYKAGGINAVTTNIGSWIMAVVTCYLTSFKLLSSVNPRSVVISSALFYFNPVLNDTTFGISPDPYVMFFGVVVILNIKNIQDNDRKIHIIKKGILLGVILFAGLLFKENALLFTPFIFCVAVYKRNKTWTLLAFTSISIFISGVLFIGLFYWIHTNDFFFRVHQIQSSYYPDICYYASFFRKEMMIRLTYGVWREFFMENFYPMLLAMVALVAGYFLNKNKGQRKDFSIYLLILLGLALYFPFSFSHYQPLCFKTRHFLFLLPLAVVVSTTFLEEGYSLKHNRIARVLLTALLLGICIYSSLTGWYWVFIRCFLLYYILLHLLINNRVKSRAYLMLVAILWLYMPYSAIFYQSNWYAYICQLSNKLSGNYFYFPEHDNMMHWKLFRQFNSNIHIYNIEKNPFKMYAPYYEPLSFHPGWFIVNEQYTVRSKDFLSAVDSLYRKNYFQKIIRTKTVQAYFISTEQQFQNIKQLSDKSEMEDCNCY